MTTGCGGGGIGLRSDARQLATMLAALSDRRLAGVERMLDSGRGRVSVEK
jgi:hypothetical protein